MNIKYKILAICVICSQSLILKSQMNRRSRFNEILVNDIYSNFPKNNYLPTTIKSYKIRIDSTNFNSIIQIDYEETIKIADSYYKKSDYINAISFYKKAFKDNNDKGKITDRIKLACCYSRTKKKDEAFFQLFRIAKKGNYLNLTEIQNLKDLNNLHSEKEWSEFINLITENRNNEIIKLNEQLKVQEKD